ncbi:hypothetical protein C0J52_26616 [Blattella germanica]|nr:hypothetical protein C0J52_26616 [Blattella germanica]
MKNFTTGLVLPWLWSAVTCWTMYWESWISALMRVIFPRVDTLSTCKVRNKS